MLEWIIQTIIIAFGATLQYFAPFLGVWLVFSAGVTAWAFKLERERQSGHFS